MKALAAVLLLVSLFVAPRAPAEEPKALILKSKSAILAVTPHRSAPYVHPIGEAVVEPLFVRPDPRHEQSRSSCEGAQSLCYDQASGRIVYKPARQLMPELPGLTPENISVKRDRIIFRYSF